jgi:hypothetical protein
MCVLVANTTERCEWLMLQCSVQSRSIKNTNNGANAHILWSGDVSDSARGRGSTQRTDRVLAKRVI